MAPSTRVSRLVALGAMVSVVVVGAGCGGSGGGRSTSAAAATTSATAAASGARDRWGTVWLCRPGLASDPCSSDLAATVVKRSGATHVVTSSPARNPPVDCFYVYPTVSAEPTINADLRVGFREREVAIAQASRFSQVCKVYAPVYPQITLAALEHPAKITLSDALRAYAGVLGAYRNYLAHYNHGRGVVFIGHSQGAVILIRLLQREVDSQPARRRQLVSALLLGGNATVAKGKTVGGSFANIPACTSRGQTGCVVAYSSFTTKPAADSQFGRTNSDAGVNLLSPRKLDPNLRILCVNPAAPTGGTGTLDPFLPTLVLAFTGGTLAATTPWVEYSGGYTAHCTSSGNANWLQVTHLAGSDQRPLLTRFQQPVLGLHILDINIALGNLVSLVHDEAAAYRR